MSSNSIEVLELRLKRNLKISFVSDTWSESIIDHLKPCRNPFVCALGHNSLLIYGGFGDTGNLFSGGVIIDMDSN